MECSFLENKLKSYFEVLSAKTPIPGGGSAVCCLSALSSSLLNMVLNYTIDKKGYEKYQDEIKRIKAENEKILSDCLNFIEEDSRIYMKIDKALKEKNDCEDFLKESVFLHIKICEHMEKIMNFCDELIEKGNKNLISDTGISNVFAYSAFLGAKLNIFINLKYIKDVNFKKEIKDRITDMEKKVKEKSENVNRKIIEKMGV